MPTRPGPSMPGARSGALPALPEAHRCLVRQGRHLTGCRLPFPGYSRRPVNANPEEPLPVVVKRLFAGFVATLFAYVTLYGACTALKRRGGPWNVTFDRATDGVPVLRIEHPRLLGPQPVTLYFPGETPLREDLPITAVFSVPITNAMPFGPVVFVDTSALPGTVSLNCFGHAVEMVARTLYVDFREVPWVPGTNITLAADTKPDAERLAARGQAWRGR